MRTSSVDILYVHEFFLCWSYENLEMGGGEKWTHALMSPPKHVLKLNFYCGNFHAGYS